jgi:O-antigen/teichoic acid export membrane protein
LKFLRGFSFNALSTGLVFGIGFFNQALLAKYLSREEYGHLSIWTTAILLSAMALGEWLRRGNTYVVGQEGCRDAAAGNSLIYVLVLGVILGVLGRAVASWFGVVPALGAWTGSFLGLLLALSVFQRAGAAILLGEDRIKSYALVPLVFIGVYFGANLLVWGLASLNLGGVLANWFFAVATAALAIFVLLRFSGPLRFSSAVFKRTARVGGRGAVSVILVFLLLKSDIFLIDWILGTEYAAVYRVATNFANMMQRLPDVAGAVLLAKVVRGGDKDELSIWLAQGVFLFAITTALFLIVAGPLLIEWFFPLYLDAYPPLVWVLPGLVFLAFGSILNVKLCGLGYPPVTLWAPAVSLSVNLVLNLVLIPRLGLIGAALATSISYGIWAFFITAAYLAHHSYSWRVFLRLPLGKHTINR